MENELTAIISALLEDNRMLKYRLDQTTSKLSYITGRIHAIKSLYLSSDTALDINDVISALNWGDEKDA